MPEWQNVSCTLETERSPFLGVFCAARLSSEIMEVFHEMHRYQKMIQAFQISEVPDLVSAANKRNLIQHRLLSLPPMEDMALVFRENHPNYEPCRLAMLIYSFGMIFPIAKTVEHENLTRDLREALSLSGLSAQTWYNCNWLLLWILTVGAITAGCVAERKWFVGQVGRVASRKGLSTYPEVREQLTRILWVSEGCDEAGESVWQEVEALRDE